MIGKVYELFSDWLKATGEREKDEEGSVSENVAKSSKASDFERKYKNRLEIIKANMPFLIDNSENESGKEKTQYKEQFIYLHKLLDNPITKRVIPCSIPSQVLL